MAVDYPKLREKVFQRYPLFRSSEMERQILFERSSDRLSQVVDLPAFPFGPAPIAPNR
jgi:hypothetical protein